MVFDRKLLTACVAMAVTIGMQPFSCAQESKRKRTTPWTTSRVKGSPDPPLPFRAVPIFKNVALDRPTDITWLPDAQRWVANHAGSQIVTFANDPENAVAKPLLNLSDVYGSKVDVGYATKFHHDLKNQPWCFVTFTSKRKLDDGHHLARLKVTDPTVPSFDLKSLMIMKRWKSHGHVGSSMQFGPDGMLYVSVGDGQPPYPPDGDNVGQDLGSIRATIMRIDVDNPSKGQPYRTPSDNPFVDDPNALNEIWAYGFRNPWKIAFDPASGDLVAADVGWEMREIIHRVKRGRNHGWSIMEGTQQVKPDQQPKIPITPPLFEHTHLDSRSISGGYFWQSDRIAELRGAYLYGDWMTGKVWALKFEGDEVLWQKELVDTPHRVICFMLDPTGEVYIVAYDGTILKLEPNPQADAAPSFPERLSETGVFADVRSQTPVDGVEEYEVSAHHWADGTYSKQWIGLPGTEQISIYKRDDWKTGTTVGRFDFPVNTVAVKTVSYLTNVDDPTSERRLETQLLHKYDDEWRAYNYIWNEEQTDAILQEDKAIERKLQIRDSNAIGGVRSQTWRHSSRSECLLCHVWSAGTVQGFWPPQLNIDYHGKNQLDKFEELGFFAEEIPRVDPIASPDDEKRSLESRARSYLSVNCSTCHRRLGGGTADFSFDITQSLKDSRYLDAVPSQGTFGIQDAKVVATGAPQRSVLLYRALKSGRGHMPQFGSNVLDKKGIRLLSDWIESIGEGDGHGYQKKTLNQLASTDDPEKQILALCSSLESAIPLSMACNNESLDGKLYNLVVKIGASHSDPTIRDLFEHYLPEDQRVKRLGATIDELALLATEGSAARGRQLFEHAKDINCRACHKIGNVGKQIGPDLSGIGMKQTPAQILASIVRPSEKIDEKFRARQVLTSDGQVITGVVTSETDDRIQIADAVGKVHSIDADDIEDMRVAAKSAMPEQLLAGMTPAQAADLLAYLCAQRTPVAEASKSLDR